MPSWERALSRWVKDAALQYEALQSGLEDLTGRKDIPQILPYRSYGTSDRLYIHGRALQHGGLKTARANAPVWENALSTYRRFGTQVIPNAWLRIRFGEQQQDVVTDRKGFFNAEIRPTVALEGDRWYDVKLELLEPSQESIHTTAKILVPSSQARFGLISDIDDTIVYTYNNDSLKMMQILLLGNAHTRVPLPGIAAFYQALHYGKTGQEYNPIFYVSSSTWNFYDLLEEFLALHHMPAGPLLLREFELSVENFVSSLTHEQEKLRRIRGILDCYPKLSFILVGDSGQKDAQIYRQLISEYPGRIQAIYIRNINPTNVKHRQRLNAIAQEVQQLGVPFVTVINTLTAATHAVRQGWIPADALPAIKANARFENS